MFLNGSGVQYNIDGTGSMLSMPLLAEISLSETPSGLSVYATSGAHVQFPSLSTITTLDNQTTLLVNATGEGSSVDLSALTIFNGTHVTLQESNGGNIILP